jgi:hypothetical protein
MFSEEKQVQIYLKAFPRTFSVFHFNHFKLLLINLLFLVQLLVSGRYIPRDGKTWRQQQLRKQS